jgi:dCMP deaminase
MDTAEWVLKHPSINICGEQLSQEAVERLFEMSQAHTPYTRASWDNTFLQIAYDASQRSPDSETQVGAVVVSQSNHILSVGYNGWMPGVNDDMIPNTRPLKHTWVIHAELNAILNCEHRPVGAKLYCTHQPCLNCFFACVAAGISEVIHISDTITTNTQDTDVDWEVALFLARYKTIVRRVKFTPNNKAQ